MPRRLFEQSTETTPGNLSDRLGYGRAGVPTKNITWTNLLAWLNSVLSFMKPSNNLSDVDDVATARTNLDVYDATTIDNALYLKADKSNVIEKDNTTTYTPTQDYHPATKKYVDDKSKSSYVSITSWGGTVNNTVGRVAYADNVVAFNGKFDDNNLQDGDTVFTLPTSVTVAPADIYFHASNMSGAGSARIKIASGSRSAIVEDQESATGATLTFNAVFLTSQ